MKLNLKVVEQQRKEQTLDNTWTIITFIKDVNIRLSSNLFENNRCQKGEEERLDKQMDKMKEGKKENGILKKRFR